MIQFPVWSIINNNTKNSIRFETIQFDSIIIYNDALITNSCDGTHKRRDITTQITDLPSIWPLNCIYTLGFFLSRCSSVDSNCQLHFNLFNSNSTTNSNYELQISQSIWDEIMELNPDKRASNLFLSKSQSQSRFNSSKSNAPSVWCHTESNPIQFEVRALAPRPIRRAKWTLNLELRADWFSRSLRHLDAKVQFHPVYYHLDGIAIAMGAHWVGGNIQWASEFGWIGTHAQNESCLELESK